MTQLTSGVLPQEMLRHVTARFDCGNLVERDRITRVPAVPGAYILVLAVDQVISIARPGRSGSSLSDGWYVYAGSARGPGGIRARLSRHLRRDKTVHWHVDQLTTHSNVAAWAIPLPGETECGLISALTGSGEFTATHPGFGSSDCNSCTAHLLKWQGGTRAVSFPDAHGS